jgi:hypothetical protein
MITVNENHEYDVDGKRPPSVTEIIPKPDFWCTPEQLESARVDGIENHSLIKMCYDLGDTCGKQYLIDYDAMINENLKQFGEFLLSERPMYSKKYDFAGQPDVVYSDAIIDIKRNKGTEKIHSLQLAGYSILVKEAGLGNIKKWFIAWHTGKKFRIQNVYDPRAIDIFIALRKKYDLDKAVENYMKG